MGSNSPRQICLTHGCAPGDIVCLSALPRDLMTTYPGKFEIHVATNCKSLWDHNPHIAGNHRSPPNGMEQVRLTYGHLINAANKIKWHFITAYHRDFQRKFGLSVPVLHAKGDLYLPEQHKKEAPIDGRYWIVVPGHKTDFTTKAWSKNRWQQLINKLKDEGIRMVQVGADHKGHINPLMDGVLDLVGKTNLRDLLWLVAHCDGVICPITCFMHMAACFDKPCVTIGGGREHWWWEAYVNVEGVENFGPYAQPVVTPHRYLHTQGLLDCCKDRGCWKNKVSETETDKNKSYCKLPVDDGYGQIFPECMRMITVDHVAEAVMSYYKGGDLPPIGEPKQIIIPTGAAPAKRVLPDKAVDLFAPPPEILRVVEDIPNVASVPQMVKAFTGEQKVDGPRPITEDPLDNPIIGGKMTICILMYGDYPDMHRACLGSILKTTSAERRDIRIVTNQLELTTRGWLDQMKEEGQINTLIHNNGNIKKYPAMRQLFWDPKNPIDTQWIVWFDDDSIANKDPHWYPHLAQKICAEYPKNARMIGDLRFWTLNTSQTAWAKTRPWWRNRQLQTKQKIEAPNGQHIFFAAGGFWAIETATMREAMIPDQDIGHNGGDYMVGLQLWQQGYRTGAWNHRKAHVFTSSVGRRGLNEIHTGMVGWQAGGVPKNKHTAV